MGNSGEEKKLRIHDAEFAVLIGGPYDGLKLSRLGQGDKEGSQIGLPTPQFLQTLQPPEDSVEINTGEPYGFIYDIEFLDEYREHKSSVSVTKHYSFSGDEVIAVYTSTGKKRKYDDLFEVVPRALKDLSTMLNVSIFKFDFYARFNDIENCVE